MPLNLNAGPILGLCSFLDPQEVQETFSNTQVPGSKMHLLVSAEIYIENLLLLRKQNLSEQLLMT